MSERTLAEQQEVIAKHLERTNKLIMQLENNRYLQMIDRPWKFLGMSFLQGLAVALGSTIGLAIFLTIIVYTLRSLEIFAPLSAQLKGIQDALEAISHK